MAPRKKKPISDSLSSFTGALSSAALAGGFYRDAPFSGLRDETGYGVLYNTSWLCRAAVDRIPEDCFKRGYQWVAEPEQINLIEAEERKHDIKRKKKQALAFSRRYGEGYLYFDIAGQVVSEELRIDAVRRGSLRFVNVLRPVDIQAGEIETDPLSAYFNQPKYYQLGLQQIHPSRICRFVNGLDPDTNRGVSVLAYMLQPIISAETARDNTVALTTEALIDVMGVEGLMDCVSDPVAEAALIKRYGLIRQTKATNRMIVLDKEKESFERKPSTFTTLPEIIESMRREVAAAIEIPYALLFGRSGSLGSNGDVELRDYYDNISTMQRNDVQPSTFNLDECIIRSALGNRPEEIYIDWLSLYETSDKEKAEIAKINAEAAKTAIDAGIIPAEIATEPLVNAWVEGGSFQGIEQTYADWIAGGGNDAEDDDAGVDVVRQNEDEVQDSIMDLAREILER